MIRVRGAPMAFSVRPVVAADWQELREMRLRALATDPEAFSSTHEDGARIPEQEWRARAAASEHGQEGQWFAAVDEGGRWVGTASVRGQGQSGSAGLFAMWVAPEAQ